MTATPTARRAAPPRKTGSPVKQTAAVGLVAVAAVACFLALAAGCSAVLNAATGQAPALPPVATPAATDAPQATTPTFTCDAAREAILTGTPEDVTQAMRALVHDKQAPATAREYARYYLVRDAEDPVMQEMDVTLIQSACNS